MSYSVSIVFTKLGRIKYISHLDLLRLFGRALRRAGLPFEVSAGFSKHPKIVIKRALKLGIESESEEAVFTLKEPMAEEEFRKRLQEQLPQGIIIARTLPDVGIPPKAEKGCGYHGMLNEHGSRRL